MDNNYPPVVASSIVHQKLQYCANYCLSQIAHIFFAVFLPADGFAPGPQAGGLPAAAVHGLGPDGHVRRLHLPVHQGKPAARNGRHENFLHKSTRNVIQNIHRIAQ